MSFNYTNFKGFAPEGEFVGEISLKPHMTSGLFIETCQPKTREAFEPLYSLTAYEKEDKPSAYQIYMHSIDEYDAAIKLVGSLQHWRKLTESKWFMEGIPKKKFDGLVKWREDMLMRDASTAKRILMNAASVNNDTASARKLLDIAMNAGKTRGPGRPVEPEKPNPEAGDKASRISDLHKQHLGSK